MKATRNAVFLHFVWATRDRLPLLTPEIERRVHRFLVALVQRSGCVLIGINGMADHVHLLVRMNTAVSPADLMQCIKGVSSTFIREEVLPGEFFAWQHGYGVFSLGRDQVAATARYIRQQKRHHADRDLWPEWERIPHNASPPE